MPSLRATPARALSSLRSATWLPRPATLMVFLIAGIAACSGQSCSCIAPLKGGFPIAQRHENGVQARLTSSFLKYASDNAVSIIPTLLPGGTTFTIPPTCPGSGNQVCCGSPQPTCQISVNPIALSFSSSATGGLVFSSELVVKTIQNLPVSTDYGSCVVSIDTTREGAIFMTASGSIQTPIDATTDLASLVLANANIDNIDDGDVNLDEAGSDSICSVADLGIVKGFIIDYVKSDIATVVANVIQSELCSACTDVSDCPAGATACTNGQCIGPDKMSCMQLLGIEGKANVASYFTGFSPSTSGSIDLIEAAGGYASANTGLTLGVVGGAVADPHNDCVPLVAAPPAVEVGPSPSLQGDLVPGTSTPYHVGIGIHVSHLGTLGYALWDSGSLCLGIGNDTVSQLSGATLELIMPSLTDLLPAGDAPANVRLRPQNPPTFTLGLGTFKTDTSGNQVVDQPLFTLDAKDFTIDINVLVDDRYVRVATLIADLALPLGLDTNAAGQVVLVLGDTTNALANVRVTNSDLLAETPAQLAAVFPTIVSVALGPLISNVGAFTLPTLAGLAIQPKVITSVDADSNGVLQTLAIFADVKSANAATRAAATIAEITNVTTPPTEQFAVENRGAVVPSITVDAGAEDTRPIEWSYAFDSGPTHAYQTPGAHTLTDPVLWLQGKHTITVRARVVGAPATLDTAGVTLPFFIDSQAPTGDFTVEGGRLVSHATDRISAASALRYRIGDGAFVPEGQLATIHGDPAQLSVEVTDEAGNVAALPYRAIVVPRVASGCDMGGGTSGGSAIFLVALAVVLLRRRALVAVGFLAACHHGSDVGTADQLDPKDSIGRYHDLVSHDDTLVLSAYDSSYGDLAYAQVSVSSLQSPIEWVYVDGDDATTAADPSLPYRHGHNAPGPDVGSYSSVTLTSGNDARIGYFDATTHAVKYAAGPFPFATQEVERGSADGTVEMGRYATIAVDLYDKPAIAYMATGLGDGMTGYRTELHFARASTSSPVSFSDWTVTTVDSAAASCAGRCATGSACVLTAMVNGVANTNPALSTCVTTDLAACPTACGAKQACIDATCVDAIQPPNAGDLPEGTGLYAHLLRAPTGKFSLVYYDRTNGRAMLALEGADGTLVPAVLDGMTKPSDVGQFSSSTYGADGTLHVAYGDAYAGSLLYRAVTPDGAPGAIETVDDGVRMDGPHLVGASASLVATSGVQILYQDQSNADLMLATRSTGWTANDVKAGADGEGFSSHIASASGQSYSSTWIFDRSKTPLGSFAIAALPASP